MNSQSYTLSSSNAYLFSAADEDYVELKKQICSEELRLKTHNEMERFIEEQGRELLRKLFQSHLDLRGTGEASEGVVDAEGVARIHKRKGTRRALETVLGSVEVERSSYGKPAMKSLFPVDADLNLPEDKYSLELRRRVAELAANSSFDDTSESIAASTGAHVPKRQVRELVQRASVDFEAFYSERSLEIPPADTGDILALTFDGKGIVMRTEDLRDKTREAATNTSHKLKKRLTRGEKRNRKRMATVAAVYTIAPWKREAEDIVRSFKPLTDTAAQRPRPENKRVWASVTHSVAEVIADTFSEALRRDPERQKKWVVLIDGDRSLRIKAQAAAKQHGVEITVIQDIIHVLEYLWKAAYVFHDQATVQAEQWVTERLRRILNGKAGQVAGGMLRGATMRKLPPEARKAVDDCAKYLKNRLPYLRYDKFLAEGMPIATGVIEGACRHLVRRRMEVSGARWSLEGAEAVLQLRALRNSGDLAEYWPFHQQREHQRNHASAYEQGRVPTLKYPDSNEHLRVIK